MTDKALISSFTWRTLESQKEALPDMPHYIAPDEITHLLRVTTRKNFYRIHVVSLGVIADKEKDFREFLSLAKQRKCEIISLEDNKTFPVNGNCENLVKWWKDARRKGSSKIGGKLGGEAKKKAVEERAKNFTKAEWVNGSIKNAQLVEKYDMSINTLRRIASDRGWGHDRQRAIWRAEGRKK